MYENILEIPELKTFDKPKSYGSGSFPGRTITRVASVSKRRKAAKYGFPWEPVEHADSTLTWMVEPTGSFCSS